MSSFCVGYIYTSVYVHFILPALQPHPEVKAHFGAKTPVCERFRSPKGKHKFRRAETNGSESVSWHNRFRSWLQAFVSSYCWQLSSFY